MPLLFPVECDEPGDRLTITIRGDGAAKEIRAAKSEQSALVEGRHPHARGKDAR
jgi:hypothetical protein